MTPRDEISLRQMLDHACELSQFANGRSRSDLDTDRLFNLAMTRLLEVVGEAASRVPQRAIGCGCCLAPSYRLGFEFCLAKIFSFFGEALFGPLLDRALAASH